MGKHGRLTGHILEATRATLNHEPADEAGTCRTESPQRRKSPPDLVAAGGHHVPRLLAAQQGDGMAAGQVLATLEGLENPYLSGRHLLMVAGVQAALDPPRVAIATLRRAFAAGLPFGVELHALPMFRPLAGRAEFRALLRPGV